MIFFKFQRGVDKGNPVCSEQSENAGTGGRGTNGCSQLTKRKQPGGDGGSYIQELHQSGERIS